MDGLAQIFGIPVSYTHLDVYKRQNMDGSVGERAKKCEALAKTLEERTGLHVVLWDERRTTVAAHDILHQTGKKTKKHRQTVDAVAASLILQGYLDFKRRNS